VSITPGTVLAVKAYKQFTGERRLVDVPSSYYTVGVDYYGAVRVTKIVCPKPLSSYKDQGYTDDLYVTYQSSIGPNVVDILQYIISRYTDLSYDTVSFAQVRPKVDAFPANFPILDRKNTIELLQDIAYQARCALWVSNGKVYLKYLPVEPDAVDTITESDIDAEKGITTELTSTEDIVTKMKIKWRMSWSPGQTDREKDKSEKWIILRHNVNRYGIQEEERDFYIYNQPDIVYKCATFWLIRRSTTWKRIKFSTFLHKLNLETFDCVLLDFSHSYVSTGPVKAVVEKASYNSDTNQIDIECLVPIKAGQMTKYPYFWPSGLPISLTWPPPDEVAAGDAGGDGIGMGAGGELPIGYFNPWGDDVVIVGGHNVVFQPHSDWGRNPTDVGFQAQSVVDPSQYGEVQSGPKPRLNLRVFMAEPTHPQNPGGLDAGFVIDLRRTHIIDPDESPHRYVTLSSFFKGFGEGGGSGLRLMMRDDALIHSSERPQGAQFDFKYASEYEIFGAGTAFLRETE
jgi:hypothetical protein